MKFPRINKKFIVVVVSLNVLYIDFLYRFYIGHVGWRKKKKSIDTFLSENAVINYLEKLLVIFLIFPFFNVSEIIRSAHSTWGTLLVLEQSRGVEI